MTRRNCRAGPAAVAVLLLGTGLAPAQVTTFSGSGANPTDTNLTTPITAFRTALGPLNANVAGIQNGGAGRREINWDGVPAASSAPNALPPDFFNTTSPRGVVLATAGTGFEVSGATTDAGPGQPAAANFGNINATYTTTFQPFSPQRLFTALGSTITNVNFFNAGSTTPALVRGFGVVFSDVDNGANALIQLFDASNVQIGATLSAPAFNGGLSFIGATVPTAQIRRVQITSGNAALAAGTNDGGATDLVVMDDFIYAEPVPEPSSLALLGLGAAGFAAWRRGRKRTD